MTDRVFTTPKIFITSKKSDHVPLELIAEKSYDAWLKKQSAALKAQIKDEGFGAKSSKALAERGANGKIKRLYFGLSDDPTLYDFAKLVDILRGSFSKDFLEGCSFELKASGLKKGVMAQGFIGWGLAHYVFDPYKSANKAALKLVWHKDADKKRVEAYIAAVYMLRNLINIPANDMGPDEMEEAAEKIAAAHKAKLTVIKGAKLKKDFPLVHTVGMGSPRDPRLLEITHGKASDPKLVIIGKGVVFDTGGLDIKPSQYMRLMKKDMGGAAHALALGQLVMALKIPVHLRIIIPCVENAVGGASFRPGDIMTSRKGLSVENTNTDAEGRLILADALTYATETKPDLVIDFATLTGSARAALGPDVPAMFSNSDKVGAALQKHALDLEDPLWRMPLWEAYHATIESPIADLVNSAGVPGDLIYSALFLQKFLVEHKGQKPDWVHLDIFAWENNGKPGRAKGATEMGLRACLALIEERYG